MSTVTSILGTDIVATSPSVINGNFANLNTDKVETSLLTGSYTTTSNLTGSYSTTSTINGTFPTTSTLLADYTTTSNIGGTYITTSTVTGTYATTSTLLASYDTSSTVAGTYLTSSTFAGNPSGGIQGNTGSTDNAVLRANGTGGSVLQATGVTVDDGNHITATSSVVGSMFQLVNTNAGATGVLVKTHHNTASPANSDLIYEHNITGEDSAGNETVYGRIQVVSDDVTNNQEDGSVYISRVRGGSLHDVAEFRADYWQLATAGSGGGKAYIDNGGIAFFKTDANNGIYSDDAGSRKVRVTATDGIVHVGAETSSVTGTVQSIGDNDLVLKTGNATTGSITITDGANGDITLAPNGTGSVLYGSDKIATTSLVAGTYATTSTLLASYDTTSTISGTYITTSTVAGTYAPLPGATTYFIWAGVWDSIGNFIKSNADPAQSDAAVSQVATRHYLPQAGTFDTARITTNGDLSSNSATINFHKNGSVVASRTASSAADGTDEFSSLSISVSAGDYVEIQYASGATNPGATIAYLPLT